VAMDQKIHNPGKKWKRILLVSVQSIVDDSHMSGFRLDGARYCMVHGCGQYRPCRQEKSDSFVAVRVKERFKVSAVLSSATIVAAEEGR